MQYKSASCKMEMIGLARLSSICICGFCGKINFGKGLKWPRSGRGPMAPRCKIDWMDWRRNMLDILKWLEYFECTGYRALKTLWWCSTAFGLTLRFFQSSFSVDWFRDIFWFALVLPILLDFDFHSVSSILILTLFQPISSILLDSGIFHRFAWFWKCRLSFWFHTLANLNDCSHFVSVNETLTPTYWQNAAIA